MTYRVNVVVRHIQMGLLGNSAGDKPLARKYFNELKKSGATPEEMRCLITSIKESGSGEWLLINTDECVALINAESKVGKQFWEFVQSLKGKLRGLELYPAKGKLGFDVEPSETVGWWSDDGEEWEFSTQETTKKPEKGMASLTLEAMTVPPTSVETDSGNKSSNTTKKTEVPTAPSGNKDSAKKLVKGG